MFFRHALALLTVIEKDYKNAATHISFIHPPVLPIYLLYNV